MKNKSLLLIVIIVCFCVSFVVYENYNKEKIVDKSHERYVQVNKDKIDEIMDNMTIEEKIGQMLIINTEYDSFVPSLKETFDKVKPGGVILMKNNISNYEDTKKFVEDMKNSSNVPFIVSMDQEGGRVQRMKYLEEDGATYIPDMYSVGLTNDSNIAYQIGEIMAMEMRTIGVNVDFAPVVDVYSNLDNTVIGNRSFGSDTKLVSKMATNLANGLEDNGVIATYKHFPGHGDTSVDSHKKLPIIYKSKSEAEKLELIPFREAIKNNAKLIMIGHIAFPLITESEIPSSLSKKMVTDILKGELGYKGLVITDALNMKALTDNYSNEEIYVKAVEAGNDILLMPEDSILAIKVIKENISEERIDESVRKILTFKYTYLDKFESLDKSFLGREEYKKILENVVYER